VTERRLLLATRNRHKLREIEGLLSGLPIRILTLDDLGLARLEGEDSVEIFNSFEENALAKARFYRQHSDLEVVADDSGLCVDALEGGPGVRSRRFAADQRLPGESEDAANNRFLLQQLRDIDARGRRAHYRCALACVGERRTLLLSGRVEGSIVREERGKEGFGYDPLFLLPGHGRTFGELPPEVKASISHRAEAIRSFRRWLEPL